LRLSILGLILYHTRVVYFPKEFQIERFNFLLLRVFHTSPAVPLLS
jgi:hypothetical protein